ncbi:MAG: hypothetical protein LBM03_00480 [Erysipelotrichaceae bacterium]|jgi:hypothetical protein|nr:hypothetical protein [Erysipelotrichaceae bacterium]
MRDKSMLPFWIVNVGLVVATAVLSIIVYAQIIVTIGTSMENALAIISTGMAGLLMMLISGLGVVTFVMSIVHLVYYCNGRFINNDSKVVHALFQFFFGLGLIGLLIVLLYTPKKAEVPPPAAE